MNVICKWWHNKPTAGQKCGAMGWASVRFWNNGIYREIKLFPHTEHVVKNEQFPQFFSVQICSNGNRFLTGSSWGSENIYVLSFLGDLAKWQSCFEDLHKTWFIKSRLFQLLQFGCTIESSFVAQSYITPAVSHHIPGRIFKTCVIIDMVKF